MSSLTKFLHVDRKRRHISERGGMKTPMLMHYPVPEGFETACISLRTGGYHTVRVRPQRPTRSGFFELDVDAEEESFSSLVSYLYEDADRNNLGNASEVSQVTQEVLDDVLSYFEAYELRMTQVFVGLVGFAALVTEGLLDFPIEIEDPTQITEKQLSEWMSEHFHVGHIDEVPVFFCPHLGPYVTFSSDPKEVGVLTRVGDYVSVVVHNAERSVVILRIGLAHDDTGPHPESSEEEH